MKVLRDRKNIRERQQKDISHREKYLNNFKSDIFSNHNSTTTSTNIKNKIYENNEKPDKQNEFKPSFQDYTAHQRKVKDFLGHLSNEVLIDSYPNKNLQQSFGILNRELYDYDKPDPTMNAKDRKFIEMTSNTSRLGKSSLLYQRSKSQKDFGRENRIYSYNSIGEEDGKFNQKQLNGTKLHESQVFSNLNVYKII